MCYCSRMKQDISTQNNYNAEHVTECLLACLNEREKDVIRNRWALGRGSKETLEAIGKKYGITRERVRQIERASFQKIKRLVDYKAELVKLIAHMDRVIEKFGGIIAQHHMVEELMRDTERVKAVLTDHKNSLFFLLQQFMREFFHFFESTDVHNEGWSKDHLYKERIKEIIERIQLFLHTAGKPVPREDIAKHLNATVDSVYSYLRLSKTIEQSPFGSWGLTNWPEVRAKRMADRIYTVLKKYNVPLHYRDISSRIASHYNRPIHPPTVHNELIADDRFVLVGRGMYALKEWGYAGGTVHDVVLRTLLAAGHPLSREEIIQAVQKQRLVARSTIVLAINLSNKIGKIGKDMYKIS